VHAATLTTVETVYIDDVKGSMVYPVFLDGPAVVTGVVPPSPPSACPDSCTTVLLTNDKCDFQCNHPACHYDSYMCSGKPQQPPALPPQTHPPIAQNCALGQMVCYAGCLQPVPTTECPSNAGTLEPCNRLSLEVGDMCEASGECGTNSELDNCGGSQYAYDVYQVASTGYSWAAAPPPPGWWNSPPPAPVWWTKGPSAPPPPGWWSSPPALPPHPPGRAPRPPPPSPPSPPPTPFVITSALDEMKSTAKKAGFGSGFGTGIVFGLVLASIGAVAAGIWMERRRQSETANLIAQSQYPSFAASGPSPQRGRAKTGDVEKSMGQARTQGL